MLSEKEQIVLLELLFHGNLTRKWFLKNTDCFYTTTDFFQRMKKLKDFGLVMNDGININKDNSKSWYLTFKGQLRAKLIALDKNNPKDYGKNKKDVVLFEI